MSISKKKSLYAYIYYLFKKRSKKRNCYYKFGTPSTFVPGTVAPSTLLPFARPWSHGNYLTVIKFLNSRKCMPNVYNSFKKISRRRHFKHFFFFFQANFSGFIMSSTKFHNILNHSFVCRLPLKRFI